MAAHAQAQVARMSSKGQLVIPEGIRSELGLEEGTLFVVFGRKEADSILLKKLEFQEPGRAFEEMARWGRQHAKASGLDASPVGIVEAQHKRRRARK